jgi:hypothetical protein
MTNSKKLLSPTPTTEPCSTPSDSGYGSLRIASPKPPKAHALANSPQPFQDTSGHDIAEWVQWLDELDTLPVESSTLEPLRKPFKFKFCECAPAPEGVADKIWDKAYNAANSRMYNKNEKNASKCKEFRKQGVTRDIALGILKERNETTTPPRRPKVASTSQVEHHKKGHKAGKHERKKETVLNVSKPKHPPKNGIMELTQKESIPNDDRDSLSSIFSKNSNNQEGLVNTQPKKAKGGPGCIG